jgi:hypothetical protein
LDSSIAVMPARITAPAMEKIQTMRRTISRPWRPTP